MGSLQEDLETQGFAIATGVLSAGQILRLASFLKARTSSDLSKSARLLRIDENELDWLCAGPFGDLIENLVLERPKIVRSLFFNKTLQNNWFVPWHQDRTIAVAQKHIAPGFKNWTTKEGIPHVEPPPSILERMVTARVHLDDDQTGVGALRVMPGSHKRGRLEKAEIDELLVEHAVPPTCELFAGDVMVMKPLLLHSSAKSRTAGNRRILQLEYSPDDLPQPLQWHGQTSQPSLASSMADNR